MKWLEETHGRAFELLRHFLRQYCHSDFLSAPAQRQSVAIGVFSLVLPAGILLVDRGYFAKYMYLSSLLSPEPYQLAVLADRLSLLTLVMALTGLLTVLQWEVLFPGRRDYLALASLPIERRQIFWAKAAGLALFAALFIGALNFLPSLVFPLASSSPWRKEPSVLAQIVVHGVSSTLACCFVLLAVLALQGVLLNLLPVRLFWRLSVWCQAAVITAFFCVAVLSFPISDLMGQMGTRPGFALWLPPVWFLGLHQTLLGDREPFVYALAARALLGFATAAMLALASYVVSYHRHGRLLLETPLIRREPWEAGGWVLGRSPGSAANLALFCFIAKTVARSRQHRLVILGHLGVALALIVTGFLAGTSGGLLYRLPAEDVRWQHTAVCAPLLLSMFGLAGLRHTFSLPAEWPANWTFRITEYSFRADWMEAVERFAVACAVAPIVVITFPLLVGLLGWHKALAVSGAVLALALLLYEAFFRGWEKIPFTCSYAPGRRPLLLVLLAYIGAVSFAVPLVGGIILASLHKPLAFLTVLGVLVVPWILLRRTRQRGLPGIRLRYEEGPEQDGTTLRIEGG